MSSSNDNLSKRQRGRPPVASECTAPSKKYRKNAASETNSTDVSQVVSNIEIADSIMNKLLTGEPCAIAELCLSLPNIPKEKIQMMVDLLVIFGQIIQIRLKDNQRAANSSSTKSNSKSPNLYAVSNFVKSPLPVFGLNKISEVVDEKLKHIKAINARNAELMVIFLYCISIIHVVLFCV